MRNEIEEQGWHGIDVVIQELMEPVIKQMMKGCDVSILDVKQYIDAQMATVYRHAVHERIRERNEDM